MKRLRVIPFCGPLFLLFPLVCSAQSNSGLIATAALPSSSAVTSVHELQIPEKARNAYNKGLKLLAANDCAASIAEFQKAIRVFPSYYEAYADLGSAELDLQQWDAAQSAFRKSMELSDNHYAPANFGLGLILATVAKNFGEAEAVVRSGLELAPSDVAGHFVLGWVLYSTARLQEAEAAAREAVSTAPSFGGGWLLLAQIHIVQKKFSSAVDDMDSYLALGLAGPLDETVRSIRAQALSAVPKTVAHSDNTGSR